MRMIKIIRGIFIINILFLVLIQCQVNNKIDYRVIQVKNGWGYELFREDRIIIHQEIIPAIEGNSPFLSRSDARKTGELALYKLSTGKLPVITRQDLDSLEIAYP
jgi:Domain of unknown function (DUF4907)